MRRLYLVRHSDGCVDVAIARMPSEAHELTPCLDARDDLSCHAEELDVRMSADAEAFSSRLVSRDERRRGTD